MVKRADLEMKVFGAEFVLQLQLQTQTQAIQNRSPEKTPTTTASKVSSKPFFTKQTKILMVFRNLSSLHENLHWN